MTRCSPTSRRNSPRSGRGHDDDLAAERHHREAEHAGRVGERRHRQVARPAGERVAHQRDRGHRLERAPGQHHALRAGRSCRRCRPASRGRRPAPRRTAWPGPRRASAPATGPRQLRRRGRPGWPAAAAGPGPARRAPAYEAANSRTRQSNSSSSCRVSSASLRGLIGAHTAPARAMPKTVAKATGSLPDSTATVWPGSSPAAASARATCQLCRCTSPYVSEVAAHGEQRCVRAERGALVQVADQAGGRHRCSVTTGSSTRPNCRSTPSSCRWPNAWQAEAKPTRAGGCCSSDIADQAWSSPVCL